MTSCTLSEDGRACLVHPLLNTSMPVSPPVEQVFAIIGAFDMPTRNGGGVLEWHFSEADGKVRENVLRECEYLTDIGLSEL